MRFIFISALTALIVLLSGIFEKKAYAYLNPGTGSYIFQLLMAAVIGGLFAVKLYWNRIVSFFKDLFSKKDTHG